MSPGELWYLNVSQPHRVWNKGPAARTHLVIDCAVNQWLLGLAREAIALGSAATASEPGDQARVRT
jgi:hypothetical protein